VPYYSFERVLGLLASADVLSRFPKVTSTALEERVDRIGSKVLANWPHPLRGYDYDFGVVKHDHANAYACATGIVYVTTGLLDMVEDDAELEAVLAHEVTHCERRHSLQQYFAAVDNANGAAFVSLLLGGLVLASDLDLDVALNIAQAIDALSSLVAQTVTIGHGRTNEEEADAYAVIYSKRLARPDVSEAMNRVLAKFQYEETADGDPPQQMDALSTHPDIEQRIRTLENTQIVVPDKPIVFEGIGKSGEVAGRLSFVAWSRVPEDPTGAKALAREYAGLPRVGNDYVTLRVFANFEPFAEELLGARINSATLSTGRTSLVLDNFEDTRVHAGGATAFSLQGRVEGAFAPDAVGGLAVILPSVQSWRRADQ
jgi:Zn-dependent protease with chaperone function